MIAYSNTGEFIATIRSSNNAKTLVRYLYENWLMENAKIILKEKVERWSEDLGIEVQSINIKILRKRWGGLAKDKKTINLNLNLLKAPDEVIDCIILHELCHAKIGDHTHHYWDLVHRHMPSYQEKIEWLNANTIVLIG